MKPDVEQMHVFFEPRSVAVVGASRKIMKAGHVIFQNFVDNKRRGIFKGELYPINLHEKTILGYTCYPSISEVDLPDYGPAPELVNDVWLNTDRPLRIAELRGKVVLLEFWTFG